MMRLLLVAGDFNLNESLQELWRVIGEVLNTIWLALINFRVPTNDVLGLNDFWGTIVTILIVLFVLSSIIRMASGFVQKLTSVIFTLLVIYVVILAFTG